MDRWSRIDRRKFGHSCISVLRSCAMCAVLRQIQRWKQLQRRDTRPLSVFRGQRKMKNRPSYSRLLLYEISLAFALWCWEDHLDRGRERDEERKREREREILWKIYSHGLIFFLFSDCAEIFSSYLFSFVICIILIKESWDIPKNT